VTDGSPLVDWTLAERTAGLIGGSSDARAGDYEPAAVAATGAEAIDLVGEYAGLGTVAAPPRAELVSRRAWSDNALRTLADATLPVEHRLAERLSAAGPAGGVAQRVAGAAAGAEAGAAVGYAARKVLGQYDIALFGEARPARLLFVAENMDASRRELEADPEVFLRWVALHEATHVIQFERVDWLADHVRRLARELIDAAAGGIDAAALRGLARTALSHPRDLLRSLLRGELAQLLADPRQREMLDRLQATMSVIEGHAEHVMDSAAPELGDELADLRRRLDARRARRGGLGDAIGRLLGMDLKLRQYEQGKRFCDGVVAQSDEATLRRVWASPQALPDLQELADPGRWLARTTAIA
jgi:coenzyme F420 biosynthesis associated uncharacterized protein